MSSEQYYTISIIISIIMAIFTMASLIFACVQLWQIRSNRKKQFDQARREKTVEIVSHYVKDTTCNSQIRAVEKIVSTFTDEQCQDLYNFVPFIIDEKTKNKICPICPCKEACEKRKFEQQAEYCKDTTTENYMIKDSILHFIRTNIISYLNAIECVLLSWQLGIVEQRVIEEQFVFLDRKRKKERALEIFRTIAGNGHSYPAIEKFYQHLDQKRTEAAKETLKDILQ